MGSYDCAVMTGFICRLCSELNRNVVHIYSEKGREMQLAEKINLMPISVEPQDSLPKTICRSCCEQLDAQYRLIQQLRRSREKILEHQERMREAERQRTSNCESGSSNSEIDEGTEEPSPNTSTED